MVLMHVTHYKHCTNAHDTTYAWHGSYQFMSHYMASVVARTNATMMHVTIWHGTNACDINTRHSDCGMGPMHVQQ